MKKDFYLENAAKEEKENTESVITRVKRRLDPHIAIIAMQSGICIIVILICIIIKLFFGEFFADIKLWYDKNITVDTDVKQVTQSNDKGSGGPLELNEALLTGQIAESFAMPVSGTLTSSYGTRTDPFTGETAVHNGLDIAAEAGTPIMAVLDGRVELAKNTSGDYGNYIIIDHGGFKTLYGHCDELKAKVGQKVTAGEIIATCGNTGRSTGPHLHFEIRIGDKRIDPTPFIKTQSK